MPVKLQPDCSEVVRKEVMFTMSKTLCFFLNQ